LRRVEFITAADFREDEGLIIMPDHETRQ
jgi:hypothetical protein